MTWILLSIMVVATALSDILQSYEMKQAGAQSVGARGLGRLLRMIVARRYLLLSIVCLAFSFFAFMALVQSAPLSFAVPASAASFILETAMAKLLLQGTDRTAPRRRHLAGVVRSGACWEGDRASLFVDGTDRHQRAAADVIVAAAPADAAPRETPTQMTNATASQTGIRGILRQ